VKKAPAVVEAGVPFWYRPVAPFLYQTYSTKLWVTPLTQRLSLALHSLTLSLCFGDV
jgi:hypothetical protein